MNIIYRSDNIFDATEKYIIHGCNAQGVMGSGLAKQIRDKYPVVFDRYYEWVSSYKGPNRLLGQYQIVNVEDNDRNIINAITQEFYGRDSKTVYVDYDAVRTIFKSLNELLWGKKIAIPMIGCGLANGDWSVISKIIEKECKDLEPFVYLNGQMVPRKGQ